MSATPDSPTIDALHREIAELEVLVRKTRTEFQRDFLASLTHMAFTGVLLPPPPPDGILTALVRLHGPPGLFPPHLTVCSSDSSGSGALSVGNAANASSFSYFCSCDAPDQWISYQFAGSARVPFAYLLRSCPFGAGSVHPRSWVLEGSSDGSAWFELDRRSDTSELNGANQVGSWGIREPQAFERFRLRQTGVNHSGNHIFAIAYFDLCIASASVDTRPWLTFTCDQRSPFKGIIAHLTHSCGTNPVRAGLIRLTSHPFDGSSSNSPENALDLTDVRTCYWSVNQPNQFLGYDFVSRRLIVREYAIRSTSGGGVGYNHLKSWVIEVRDDDGTDWIEVDRHENNQDLNRESAVGIFTIQDPIEGRFIRIRQTDVNHYRDSSGAINSLVFSAMEFFGDLIE
jgi:hypothetical protein